MSRVNFSVDEPKDAECPELKNNQVREKDRPGTSQKKRQGRITAVADFCGGQTHLLYGKLGGSEKSAFLYISLFFLDCYCCVVVVFVCFGWFVWSGLWIWLVAGCHRCLWLFQER